jgi:hypothetical protein
VVVLIRDADHLTLVSRRRLSLSRVTALLRADALDEALAAGVSPDSGAALSLRARILLRHSVRRRLGRQLRDVIKRADQPRGLWDPTVPLAEPAIHANRDEIVELARWLEDTEPVGVRGVAQLRLLLCHGTSPLYRPATSDQLEEALMRIGETLDPFHALLV